MHLIDVGLIKQSTPKQRVGDDGNRGCRESRLPLRQNGHIRSKVFFIRVHRIFLSLNAAPESAAA